MLKVGLYVDGDNLASNGGFGMDYLALRDFAESRGHVLRANAYFSVDEELEDTNPDIRRKRSDFRNILRSFGYFVFTKPVKKYVQPDGSVNIKSNTDLEIATDLLMQSHNLDYVLLCTGDGDFVRVVQAVKNMGKRVEVLGFKNVSTALVQEADYFHSGYLIPGITTLEDDKHIGFLHHVRPEKGFGFITLRTGMHRNDFRDDIFVHMSDVEGVTSNTQFGKLQGQANPVAFRLEELPDGRTKAINVQVL